MYIEKEDFREKDEVVYMSYPLYRLILIYYLGLLWFGIRQMGWVEVWICHIL